MVNSLQFVTQPIKQVGTNASSNSMAKGKNSAFAQVLQSQVSSQPVKVSAHAQKRLQERNIILGTAELTKINQAIEKAAAKGSKETLLIYNHVALVASVKNKTLVTAIDGENLKDHIITNIDSAVFI